MGTVRLFNSLPQAQSAGWHEVRSPGGYEWWRFDVVSPESVRVLIDIFDGCPFHPEYARRYAAYRAAPTRNAPPVPAECPCVHIRVVEAGRLIASEFLRYSTSKWIKSAKGDRLRMDRNRLRVHRDNGFGVIAETFRSEMSAVFALAKSTINCVEIQSPNSEITGSDQFWINGGRFDVKGGVRLRDGRRIDFKSSNGFVDHRLGLNPLTWGTKRLMFGRITVGHQSIAFTWADPLDADRESEQQVILTDQAYVREIHPGRMAPDWNSARLTRWGLRLPNSLDIGPDIILRDPNILKSEPASILAEYKAYLNGEPGMAICEVIYPQRLSSQFFGRLTERGIQMQRR